METLKRIIWNLIPYDLEIAMRSILQPGFKNRHIAKARETGHKITEIETLSRPEKKISIVFFATFRRYGTPACQLFRPRWRTPN